MKKNNTMNGFRVIKRNGDFENLIIDKINKSVERATQGLTDVCASEIVLDASLQLYDGVSTVEIDKALILSARTKIEKEPNYSYVAARLLLNTLYKEAFGAGVNSELFEEQYKAAFIENINLLIENNILDERLEEFDLDYLSEQLDIKRDLKFKYLGIHTLYDRYFLHINKVKLETPQAFFMRVAMGLAINEKNKEERAISFYNLMSNFLYMPSTPTLFNSGCVHSQLSSCYLSTVHDSEDGIMGTIHDQARLSKYAGGLGTDWTPVRGTGTKIKGTNGESSGIIPFLKISNDTIFAWNQGGRRPGSGCAYLEVFHTDIEDFLDLRKNTGDDRRRCHDMNTAVWIPDLFIKKVLAEEEWHLFSPDEAPDLHDLYGEAFEERYEYYVKNSDKMRGHRVLPAKLLWKKILTSLYETSHPWICFKDAANICYSNKNAGVVHSSNLCTEILRHSIATLYKMGVKTKIGEVAVCLAEGSMVLTSCGYLPIEKCDGQLVYTEFKSDIDFNQKQTFEKAKLIHNGQKDVYKVTLNNGNTIIATGNHQILIKTKTNSKLRYKKQCYDIPDEYKWIKLEDLQINDLVAISNNNSLINETKIDDDFLVAGWLLGDGWQTKSSYGVCFGPKEIDTRDFVINKIKEWFKNVNYSGNGRFPIIETKQDSNGVWFWASENTLWKRFLNEKFGFCANLAKDKTIPQSIKLDFDKKSSFLSGLFSADGCVLIDKDNRITISLTSASQKLLVDVQRILHEFGIKSVIIDSFPRKRYQGSLRIHGYNECNNFAKYINFHLCKPKMDKLNQYLEKNIIGITDARNCSKVKSIIFFGKMNVYDLEVENKHHFVTNGIIVHNCNLGSINYAEHLYLSRTGEYRIDELKLAKTVNTAIRMLDNVIDLCFYPIAEASNSNKKHRPIGLGAMGFTDVLHALNMNYESPGTPELASYLQELVAYNAIKSSIELAKERGAFSSYDGSEWSKGNFPQDCFQELANFRGNEHILYPSKIGERKWGILRQQLISHGIRNASIMAIAPTATISSVCGCGQSSEPDFSILFVYSTLSGEFTMINEWFVREAKKLGLWCEELLIAIKQVDGDVSKLSLPKELQDNFKTAFDIDYKSLIDAASARTQWIDMGQSFNLYTNKSSLKYLNDMYLYAYKKLLKTTYYLRNKGASQVEKSTVPQAPNKMPQACSIEAMKRGEVCESCQ